MQNVNKLVIPRSMFMSTIRINAQIQREISSSIIFISAVIILI